MEYIIHVLITSTLFTLIMYFSRRDNAVKSLNGILVLKYSKGVLFIILTIVSLVPLTGGIFFLLKFGAKTNIDLMICTIWLSSFFIIGFYIFMRFSKELIIISNEKIQAFYTFGKPKEFTWKEINKVNFSELNKWLVLEAPDKQKIRLSIMLSGFQDFCALAKQKLPYEYMIFEIEKASSAKLV